MSLMSAGLALNGVCVHPASSTGKEAVSGQFSASRAGRPWICSSLCFPF